MPVLFVFVITFSLMVNLGLTILNHVELRTLSMYEESHQYSGLIFSNVLERYMEETNTAPASLNELISYEGNQYLSNFDLDLIGYAVTPLSSVGLSYQKVILWHKRFDRNLPEASVVENNQSGITDFSENGDFKAPSNVYWYQTSTLSTLGNLRSKFYAQLDESAQRVVYSMSTLPKLTSTGTPIIEGDIISLVNAVGYSGSFSGCVGVFNFDGAPLTCSDLFASDGTLVFYQLVSDSVAVLSIESNNLTDEAGTPLFLYTHVMVSAS